MPEQEVQLQEEKLGPDLKPLIMGADELRSTVSQAHDRFTFQATLTHETLNGQPISVPVGWHQILDIVEQPFGPRRVKLTTEWKPLPAMWLEPEQIGQMFIDNQTGRFKQRNPTPEEQAKIDGSIVEVSVGGGVFEILPNSSWGPCRPKLGQEILLRSAIEGVEIMLTVFAR